MKVIIPQAIELLTTNAAANAEATWSAATTYNVNDLVKVTSIFPNKVYKSLRPDNLNKNPPLYTEPEIITGYSTTSNTVATGSKTFTVETGKNFSPGTVVVISKTATPKAVNMTAEVTTYTTGTGALVVNVTAVTGTGTHASWTVLSEDEVGYWEEIGATDQHKMFDEFVNTKTTNLETLAFNLRCLKSDYIALFGLVGNSITLSLWDALNTTQLWSTSVDLTYGSSLAIQISDWYEYFFGEYAFKEEHASQFGAITYDGVLRVNIISETGETSECSSVILGRSVTLGNTQFGASVGMVDFSRRETDDNGRTTVTEGYWAKTNSLTLYMENYTIDSLYRKLVQLRGIPTAWIGYNENTGAVYESMVVYGYFKEFDITVEGPTHSWCELTIEGLI